MKISSLVRTALAAGLLGSSSAISRADPLLIRHDWSHFAPTGANSPARVVDRDGQAVLEIVHEQDGPLQINLLTITNPPITTQTYAIRGEIEYQNARGDSYLEMWNYFSAAEPGLPEARYFSRTLGDAGDMAKIRGTSAWRSFSLPFNSQGAKGPPTRLEINLALAGSGTVRIRPLELVQFDGGSHISGAWWNDRTAGLVGGLGGALIGCLGSLMAWLASQGKARSFVVACGVSLLVLGGIAALALPVAFWRQQPQSVWLPLLLVGAILLTIMPGRLRQHLKQYEEFELRKIASAE